MGPRDSGVLFVFITTGVLHTAGISGAGATGRGSMRPTVGVPDHMAGARTGRNWRVDWRGAAHHCSVGVGDHDSKLSQSPRQSRSVCLLSRTSVRPEPCEPVCVAPTADPRGAGIRHGPAITSPAEAADSESRRAGAGDGGLLRGGELGFSDLRATFDFTPRRRGN